MRPPGTEIVPRTYAVRGSVRYYDTGRAAEMVRVDLRRITGEVVGSRFTQSNGEFEFMGLPSGNYQLIVEVEDYEPVRENLELINNSRLGIQLFLRRPISVRRRSEEGTITARELSIPRKASAAMQKGMEQLYQRNDFQGSIGHFQRAVAELPTYYEAYFQMGVAQERLGHVAEAEEAFRKAIELSQSRYAVAEFALASLLSNRNQFAEAASLARHGLELENEAWQGHFELARALFGLNQAEAAEKSALEARQRKSDFAPLHLLLANMHIRRGDHRALLQDLDAYLKLEPHGPMSEQARQTRAQIQRELDAARDTRPPKL